MISISEESVNKITEHFTIKSYRKKEYLLQFDNISRSEFFITSGCVRTFVTDFNGVEHNIFFSTENYWAGDLQSFINQTPATYSIQALENTEVLAISGESWKKLVSESPDFTEYSRLLFRNAVIAQQNRILQNLSYTAKERYRHIIEKHPELIQRIAQKHIASYLGITPEFLSMIRKEKLS